ncbi:archaemetzincin family Zn-dependent metalloprotease [Hydrogenimonas cancrithermarum]|uniref:Peptidase n=1 Tax=Hydrogenimonas cancrithermarum TaxID=2993563 RepID=A0ABM8FIU5_9BACT|nr:archaemetzincin family Zn-dependent metalloprotease [Hydrogenimonas cancrithermarum]BDY12204.1 peptidase [Hydrogenimonas cancrithermarum]
MRACSILLVPFFEGERFYAEALRRKLTEIFSLESFWSSPEPLSLESYDMNRAQYRAFDLLRTACLRKENPMQIVLGITEADIYEDRLNFVFGLASAFYHCAVISTARLSNRFYDMAEDKRLLFRRIVTESVHEIGHTLGLEHCPDPHCVMHFSNSLADTDNKGYRFCPNCRRKVDISLASCHTES